MADILYTNGAEAAKNSRAEQKIPSPAPGPSSELLTAWYIFRQGRFWCLANILCALLVACLTWQSISPSIIASWALFVALNSLLFLYLLGVRGTPRLNPDSPKLEPAIFFAAVLGGAWGALLFIAADHASEMLFLHLQLIVIVVTAIAIPVCALHAGAFTTYSLSLLLPAVAINSQQDQSHSLFVFYLLFFALFIAAAYFAAAQRTMATILDKYFALGETRPTTVTTDIRHFPKVADKRYRKLARLLPGQQRAKSSLDAVGDGIITTNKLGIIDYVNPIAEVMTGVTKGEALGESIDVLLRLKCTETQEVISDAIATFLDNRTTQLKRRTTLIRGDGIEYQLELIVVPLNDEDDACDGASFILREISEHNSLAKEVRWRATHDPLTKLINRIEFETVLRKLIGPSNGSTEEHHAICVLDLDKFQYINETFGHQCGDRTLVALAEEFKCKIRGADILARVGDNKFAALLYNCTRDKARMIAEGLRRIAEETTIDVAGNNVKVTISAGVVGFDPAKDTMTDILIAADGACVNAKKEGGNRVFTIVDSDLSGDTANNEIGRIRGIQNALRDNRLTLYTQAVRDNRAGSHVDGESLKHCEILLRMEDEHGEIAAPRELLANAERFQIMPELDRWAAKASLDAVRFAHPGLRDMETIFITLSGQSLNDDKFLEYLISELEDESLPSEKLCFEISHASLISSIDRAAFFVANLKEYGCQIALNDFGFAMHAFELLKRLQIDYLKIDAQFTRNMAHNSVDYEIVLALSRIAKTLRIQTIAEGVSTVALKDALQGMGIDFVQGMLIDEPRPIEALN